MIQFNEAELETLKKRRQQFPQTIQKLKREVTEVLETPVMVPRSGIANWTLYYYCPDCSLQLRFERSRPHAHVCPGCGKVWTGEPYDSAWWGLVNASNYNAAYSMAVIWLAGGEQCYADKAIEILRAYAKYYPDYEIHGNIPYNGPGRSGAQTLDEANFQRSLAMSYDILASEMSEETRAYIRDRLLLPGAEFLLAHRHRQLHNHEVIINSAIAVIGLLFERPEMVEAAVCEPYGILYQLEHGVQDNGMWFEGAFGYHFYALTSFFAFEKFALHTKYSLIHHPNYRRMMELLCDYLEPDYAIPMLNDTNYGHLEHMKNLYEFACREIGGEKLEFVLNTYYRDRERDNLEAFLYGVETLPERTLVLGNYHSELMKPGHTILRGLDGRYLLFKHDRYGGEHDHYDRLGISYLACGEAVSRDLGTTGYGARLHYDYYKNTGTHNTVVIGGANQAPVDARLTRYEARDGVVYVSAEADWGAPYTMPDSFTIVQWSEESYRGVRMSRQLAWTDSYFAEIFCVENVPAGLPVDWLMHFGGQSVGSSLGCAQGVYTDPSEAVCAPLSDLEGADKKPYALLHGLEGFQLLPAGAAGGRPGEGVCSLYRLHEVLTEVHSMNCGQQLWYAFGPDNPSTDELAVQLERQTGESLFFAHVIASRRADEAGAVTEPKRQVSGPQLTVSFVREGARLDIQVAEPEGRSRSLSFALPAAFA